MILDLTSARSFASGSSDMSGVQFENLVDDLSADGTDEMGALWESSPIR